MVSSASKLKELIFEKNKYNNKLKLVAGYCRNWISDGKEDGDVHNIEIDDFSMTLNLGNSKICVIDEIR